MWPSSPCVSFRLAAILWAPDHGEAPRSGNTGRWGTAMLVAVEDILLRSQVQRQRLTFTDLSEMKDGRK